MSPELYSPDLECRYQATLETVKQNPNATLGKKWPCGCFGTPNAFSVFLGPGMGHAGQGQTCEPGGENRPPGVEMTFGRDALEYFRQDGRRATWNRLGRALLGKLKLGTDEGSGYAKTLTALLNLDWSNSASEATIPTKYLANGFRDFIWPLLQEVRPRILCPLSDKVWSTIHGEIQKCNPTEFLTKESLASLKGKKPRTPTKSPLVFRFPSSDFETLLIKPHMHPSRGLSKEETVIINNVCAKFLEGSK